MSITEKLAETIFVKAADLLAAMASSCHGDANGSSSFDHFTSNDAVKAVAGAAFQEVWQHFITHGSPRAEEQYGEAEALLRDGWAPGLSTWWKG